MKGAFVNINYCIMNFSMTYQKNFQQVMFNMIDVTVINLSNI